MKGNRLEWILGAAAVLALGGFLFLAATGIPSGGPGARDPSVRLPKPGELGPLYPARAASRPAVEMASKTPAQTSINASSSKIFTPPPEAVRQIREEKSVVY